MDTCVIVTRTIAIARINRQIGAKFVFSFHEFVKPVFGFLIFVLCLRLFCRFFSAPASRSSSPAWASASQALSPQPSSPVPGL